MVVTRSRAKKLAESGCNSSQDSDEILSNSQVVEKRKSNKCTTNPSTKKFNSSSMDRRKKVETKEAVDETKIDINYISSISPYLDSYVESDCGDYSEILAGFKRKVKVGRKSKDYYTIEKNVNKKEEIRVSRILPEIDDSILCENKKNSKSNTLSKAENPIVVKRSTIGKSSTTGEKISSKGKRKTKEKTVIEEKPMTDEKEDKFLSHIEDYIYDSYLNLILKFENEPPMKFLCDTFATYCVYAYQMHEEEFFFDRKKKDSEIII
uniref:Uncharacterized protein n=1 Tax=Strongyloides stercoralis TaxID=6248 RepID=A0A0K0EHR1_STRER